MADHGWKEFFTPEGHAYYHNKITNETSWDKPDVLKTASEKAGQGDLIAVAHDVEGYVFGKVANTWGDGSIDVEATDGQTYRIEGKGLKVQKVNSAALARDSDDLVQLDDINEAMMVHNLRERYRKGKIYTHVGTILIAINPFQRLPLYTPAVIEKYATRGNRQLEPHTFSIADDAYRKLLETGLNQSILISGESGAGKTEATKQCLMYFAEVAGSVSGVEQNILQSNPILEAFGNAKTLRNNNSSRFGKYVEIHFDAQTRIVGAATVNYLLEKTRVVFHIAGERNYHVFYQLTKGCSPDMRAAYSLAGPEKYLYLNPSGSDCIDLDGVDDAADFEEMTSAMKQLGFTDDERTRVFSLVAAILHLGNIRFEAASAAARVEGCRVVNLDELEIAANLLGVTKDALNKAITTRLMEIRGQDPTQIPLNPTQASDLRDALAKFLYGNMFDWLVLRINDSMRPPPNSGKTKIIGVLDIFGFEIFQVNSFEQLCINYTNEQLQQQFNQHTFKLEEALYNSEGVPYERITFIDNQPVLDLIESVPKGVLPALDEELRLPKASDETFLLKCNKNFGMNQCEQFIHLKTSRTEFGIRHYAGDVRYSVTNFLDKNRDTLNRDLLVMLEASTDLLINVLFPRQVGEKKTSKISLGAQFRKQLKDLMTALNATEPHYIRCIKPNHEKMANLFHGFMSMQQMRYAGVLEAVKIRQSGYPFRYRHGDFMKRYGFMVPNALKKFRAGSDPAACCLELLKALGGGLEKSCLVGKSRVLYRSPAMRALDLKRNVAVEAVVIKIQKHARARIAREEVKKMKAHRTILRRCIQARELDPLAAAIDAAREVRFQEMREITEGIKLRDLIRKELAITAKLTALSDKDAEANYDQLKALVEEAASISFDSELVRATRQRIQIITDRRECRANLQTATAAADRVELERWIARAAEVTLPDSDPVLTAAKAELERIILEEQYTAALRAALESGMAAVISDMEWDHSTIDVAYLEQSIPAAEQFGMRTAEGKRALEEARVIVQVRRLLVAEDFKELGKLLRKSQSLGITLQEFHEAAKEVTHKCAVDDVIAGLVEAYHSYDQDSLAYGLQQATTLNILDRQEVQSSRWLHDNIVHTRGMLARALAAVEQSLLEAAVEQAKSFSFMRYEVPQAKALLEKVTVINEDAYVGLHYCERSIMESAFFAAREINMKTDQLTEIEKILGETQEKFLQRQLKKAGELADSDRVIRIMIQIKDLFFGQFGDQFVLKDYGQLRKADDYAKAKMFGREKLRDHMLEWTKEPIPTSLTVLPKGPLVSLAKNMFKNILGFTGDRPNPYPDTLAQEVLDTGVAEKDLRDEIFCQLMKQLTRCSSEVPAAKDKYWTMMRLCLQTFKPSNDFNNYLEIFLRRTKPDEKKYVMMLHDTLYYPDLTAAPRVEMLIKSNDYVPRIDMQKNIDIDRSVVAKMAAPKTMQGLAREREEEAVSAGTPRGQPNSLYEMDHVSRSAITLDEYAAQPAADAATTAFSEAEYAAVDQQPGAATTYSVRALYDFDGTAAENCLPFAAGDVLTILETYEGWYLASLNDGTGLIPANYVEYVQ